MNFRKPRPEEPEINLIPFIDVLLVILIFLMLSTTYSKFTELQVSLPVADAEPAKDRPREIIVSVAADGRYAVDRKPVDGRSVDLLAAELTAAANGSGDVMIIVSADATTAHQSVINVMDAARRAGIGKLTFATQSSNGGRQALSMGPRRTAARSERGLEALAQRVWAGRGAASTALLPFAFVFAAVAATRRMLYRGGWLTTHHLPVPVIVVGNLLVGGGGKTPAVLAIAALLARHGRRVGILSRGYGRVGDDIHAVRADSDPRAVGDEPVLLARRSAAPVFVGADRVAAGHALLQAHADVDVLLSDDGLQHLALGRDIEVLLFDDRGSGNGRLLPAGPLREPLPSRPSPSRLVLYGAGVRSTPLDGHLGHRTLPGLAELAAWRRGEAGSPDAFEALRGRRVVAAAGLARPEPFFAMLRERGLDVVPLPLADHHDFRVTPWPSTTADVVVTEKDAVKLDPSRMASRVWVATLDFVPEQAFEAALLTLLPSLPSTEPTIAAHGNPPA